MNRKEMKAADRKRRQFYARVGKRMTTKYTGRLEATDPWWKKARGGAPV